jgi:hypothetical protein
MPARNAQNPIKSGKTNSRGQGSFGSTPHGQTHNATGALHCPACRAEVPPKPGFRPASLKCPKCGAAMGKK